MARRLPLSLLRQKAGNPVSPATACHSTTACPRFPEARRVDAAKPSRSPPEVTVTNTGRRQGTSRPRPTPRSPSSAAAESAPSGRLPEGHNFLQRARNGSASRRSRPRTSPFGSVGSDDAHPRQLHLRDGALVPRRHRTCRARSTLAPEVDRRPQGAGGSVTFFATASANAGDEPPTGGLACRPAHRPGRPALAALSSPRGQAL